MYFSIKDILELSDTCKLSRNMLQNVFTVLFEHIFVFYSRQVKAENNGCIDDKDTERFAGQFQPVLVFP